MERYVKGFINRSKKNLTKDFLEKNLSGRRRGSSFAIIDNQNDEAGNQDRSFNSQSGSGNANLTAGIDLSNDNSGENSNRGPRARSGSLIEEGTGRY